MEPKKLEPFLSKGSLWSTYLSMKLSRHEFYFEEQDKNRWFVYIIISLPLKRLFVVNKNKCNICKCDGVR